MSTPDGTVLAAQIALREATRALDIANGLASVGEHLTEPQARGLAADVGRALDAVAALVQRATRQPETASVTGQTLQVLARRVTDTATLARHMTETDGRARDPINVRVSEPSG